jgi:flagellar assembly factor FliW
VRLTSAEFGEIEYSPDDVVVFPEGLPAFEDEAEFVRLRLAAIEPLVVLQSRRTPALAFLTVPVEVLDPGYRLRAEAGQLQALGWGGAAEPAAGRDVLCLAIVTLGAEPTVNLLSPLVIHPATRLGCQLIQVDAPYSCRHPLRPAAAPENSSCC